jgi:hypothetical protein
MRKLGSNDRSALIKLASSLPSGSSERRAILAGLQQNEPLSRKFANSMSSLPNAPMGYKWEEVTDVWGDTAFTLYNRGKEVGTIAKQNRNWVTYVAGEEWPIGRGQNDMQGAGFQLLDHLGLA